MRPCFICKFPLRVFTVLWLSIDWSFGIQLIAIGSLVALVAVNVGGMYIVTISYIMIFIYD